MNTSNFRVAFLYLPRFPSVGLHVRTLPLDGFRIPRHRQTISLQTVIRKRLPKRPPIMAPDGIAEELGLLSV